MKELELLYQGKDLTLEQSQQIFATIVTGSMDPIVMGSLLTALKIKGETPQEIAGAAQALLNNAADFPTPDYEFADIVGTGGDGYNTINISTTSAFVAASLGVKVSKHGNRGVSSKSGSSDLLQALGINIEMSPEKARECLDELGVCFLYAPQYHQGIRHAMPVRKALATRTLFNVLGPLINPAHPTMEVMGVYDKALLKPIAETFQQMGMKKVMVIYGAGLDEAAVHGPTDVAEVNGNHIEYYQITPEEFGVAKASIEELEGGTPEENCHISEQLLQGQGKEAHLNAVAVNVALLLKLAGKVANVHEGVELALREMRSGRPLQLVHKLAEKSQ
ncbi:anthranilate phosphoribosyltransferase [Celerinatantimonas diazotrophica]|uniref:Anthranilate phosphoribosyltransferase n=1 Tax=Celerinatantimonas diazotrophica TaxID=412034 RepID=A0A4R1JA61_9GAMM|nr:anthranilate phosphoribosyltransferase [Celerinatantimonas diazotrophica]TCK47525.1 anthranilate phosphoribosyltransferase [Celerinatantimonas diazotrophica]CAG9296857.1 Bifunctional protein TrpGD [Celerinatantimonas diazotrophica]